MFLYLGGFALAIGQGVPTGLVALMADLVPLAIAALSWPVLGQRVRVRQWLGMAIATLGVLAVSGDALRLGDAPAHAYALPVLGMLSFAVSTVLQRRMRATELPIPQALCLQCLFAAALFALPAAATGALAPPLTARFALGIGWLVGLATLAAWGIYYLALRLYPAARVSAVIYLSPPVTMLWAWALFGEPLTLVLMLGLGVTLAGVWLAAAPQKVKTS
jgi:drug/metabolite transporter (DMT)-like permease